MKKFLAIYQSTPEEMAQMANATPEQSAAVMDAWMKWKAAHENNVVDFGAPVMPGALLNGAQHSGTSGYSVLQAESMDALKAAMADHPHPKTELLEFVAM